MTTQTQRAKEVKASINSMRRYLRALGKEGGDPHAVLKYAFLVRMDLDSMLARHGPSAEEKPLEKTVSTPDSQGVGESDIVTP